jgi:hypothetical protein
VCVCLLDVPIRRDTFVRTDDNVNAAYEATTGSPTRTRSSDHGTGLSIVTAHKIHLSRPRQFAFKKII